MRYWLIFIAKNNPKGKFSKGKEVITCDGIHLLSDRGQLLAEGNRSAELVAPLRGGQARIERVVDGDNNGEAVLSLRRKTTVFGFFGWSSRDVMVEELTPLGCHVRH